MKRFLPTLVASACLLAACDGNLSVEATQTPVPASSVKVAFVRDLSVPDADEHALPALQAAELALGTAASRDPDGMSIELEPLDLVDDREEIDGIGQDPSYVAMIVAPGVNADIASIAADVPVVSLSGLGDGSPGGAWLRMTPSIDVVAGRIADRLRHAHPCILSEDPPPDPLQDLLATRMPKATARTVDPAEAATVAEEERCDVVVWAGGPDAGAEAARVLRPAGITIVGGDRLMDPDYLASAESAAEGSFAACGCASVSTSTELAARRFIQDYQSEHGSPPGPYAVEAWDAAHMILRALDEAGPSRHNVGAWLDTVTSFDGLQGVHRFGSDGEPVDPRSLVRLYRVEGGRWVRAGWSELCVGAGRCARVG